jgi:hypothetical protein
LLICNKTPSSENCPVQTKKLPRVTPATGVEAHNLATAKDFLRFYIVISRPWLAEKLTVDSINTVAEWFFAGFACVIGIEMND